MTFTPADRLQGISISLIRQWNAKKKANTIDLGIGELPWPALQTFREAGAKAFTDKALRYTANAGMPALREAIAGEFLDTINKKVRAENVLVTCGVEEALAVTFGTFINPGDEVLIPEIYFQPYEILPRMNGGVVNTFALTKNMGVNLSDLESKITDRTKLIVINSPSNPTGRVLNPDELMGLAHLLHNHPNVYVLSDEIYSHLGMEIASPPQSIAQYMDRVVVVDGMSKRAGATGARIGWMISDESVINEAVKFHQYMVSCAPTPSQYAALAVLSQEGNAGEADYRAKLRENRDLVVEGLNGYNGVKVQSPQGGFFCFADTSAHGTSGEVAQRILDRSNVLVIPGIAFGKAADSYVRISYATEKDTLTKGIECIREALR